MTETSFNHLCTFDREKKHMAQISQVSMDCQLALLSSATVPRFQLFPTKTSALPSNLRWETIASLNPHVQNFILFQTPMTWLTSSHHFPSRFLQVFFCKNQASWHRDLVVEVLYSHAESVLKPDWYLGEIFPADPKEDPRPSGVKWTFEICPTVMSVYNLLYGKNPGGQCYWDGGSPKSARTGRCKRACLSGGTSNR